MALHQITE